MDKKSLLNAIISCRKSHNKEDYLKNRATLMRLGGELNVKPGQTKKFVKFSQYFFPSWIGIVRLPHARMMEPLAATRGWEL